MNREFSLYLDVARFFAAILVLISHYVEFGVFGEAAATYVPDFGREAVIVFFVLSGYVIAYTTESKRSSLREYAIARCARIYSVAAPVLIIAFVTGFIAININDGHIAGEYTLSKAYLYIPFHLLFLGELWNFSEVPPWLGAYWSLGYEVWYYVFFGVIFYLNGRVRIFAAILILAVMGHKLWLLMPVWWAGVFLHKHQNRYRPGEKVARIGWLLTILLLIVYKGIGLDETLRELGSHIWGFHPLRLGSADRYLADYLVCLLVACNFFFALHAKFEAISGWMRPIKALASYTFTLYLVHGLVMSAWSYFYGNRFPIFLNVLLLTGLIAAATFMVGTITEQRKVIFQKFFVMLFKRRGGSAFPPVLDKKF
jgi:peptidoglycan/LPS O-acetylase OafA/YrhL